MLTRMTRSMQGRPLWPVTTWGGAARRAVVRMGGAVEENPLAPEDSLSKNPLPLGEGRVRVVPPSSDGPLEPTDPHPDPLPEGEGGPNTAPATVIAVFARSFYLANDMGEIACIGPAGLGGGPLNVLCELPAGLDFQASGPRLGETATCDGVVLRIAGRFALALAGAAPWQPHPPPAAWDGARLAAGLAALSAATRDVSGAGGLAPLVAGLAGNDWRAEVSSPQSPLLRLAVPAIVALGEFLAGRAAAPGGAADMLVGLGPGLTPSGDDLIGGAMIALHTLGRGGTARRLAGWALPLAGGRTGAISAAHLACAADGEGSAALHDLLAALLAPDDAGIVAATRTLAAIGHSSGWDMLAGAALACASVRDGFSAG
jgi:hypothetical protein